MGGDNTAKILQIILVILSIGMILIPGIVIVLAFQLRKFFVERPQTAELQVVTRLDFENFRRDMQTMILVSERSYADKLTSFEKLMDERTLNLKTMIEQFNKQNRVD